MMPPTYGVVRFAHEPIVAGPGGSSSVPKVLSGQHATSTGECLTTCGGIARRTYEVERLVAPLQVTGRRTLNQPDRTYPQLRGSFILGIEDVSRSFVTKRWMYVTGGSAGNGSQTSAFSVRDNPAHPSTHR